MVCMWTGKAGFSRKYVKRVHRVHRKAQCWRCQSGGYAWTCYVCQHCGRSHVGHLWMGGVS